MIARTSAALAVAIVLLLGGVGTRAQAPAAAFADLDAEARARAERTFEFAGRRYAEWLGPSPATPAVFHQPVTAWPPQSMALESTIAFEVARSWFAGVTATDDLRPLIDGAAWHLQSHVVEELFDLTWHQPGYRYDTVPLFGGLAHWAAPTLVLSRRARDDRAPVAIVRVADAFATLENLVGWPVLASALRSVAQGSITHSMNRQAAEAMLASTTAIPLDWFRAPIADPLAPVDDAIVSVETGTADCAPQPCFRTTVTVARTGKAPGLTIPLRVDFGDASSTFWWDGRTPGVFAFESGSAPSAVTLDPDRLSQLDANPLNQRWRATPVDHPRPIKTLASWAIWLQHAALTYAALL